MDKCATFSAAAMFFRVHSSYMHMNMRICRHIHALDT